MVNDTFDLRIRYMSVLERIVMTVIKNNGNTYIIDFY